MVYVKASKLHRGYKKGASVTHIWKRTQDCPRNILLKVIVIAKTRGYHRCTKESWCLSRRIILRIPVTWDSYLFENTVWNFVACEVCFFLQFRIGCEAHLISKGQHILSPFSKGDGFHAHCIGSCFAYDGSPTHDPPFNQRAVSNCHYWTKAPLPGCLNWSYIKKLLLSFKKSCFCHLVTKHNCTNQW